MWAHRSSTVFLSISAASFSRAIDRTRTGSVDLGVVLHEVRNAFHELALVDLLLEVLLAHVGETDEKVHED